MSDIQGWDEFSAYTWLNSANGKKSIGWPIAERVPMEIVRKYIAGMPIEKQDPRPVTLDTAAEAPAVSPIDTALRELTRILSSKKSDYSSGGDFWNFDFAADVVGGEMSTDEVIRTQIAIKLGRIQTLLGKDAAAENEPLLDSFRDLAGYAIILYAYWLDTLGE